MTIRISAHLLLILGLLLCGLSLSCKKDDPNPNPNPNDTDTTHDTDTIHDTTHASLMDTLVYFSAGSRTTPTIYRISSVFHSGGNTPTALQSGFHPQKDYDEAKLFWETYESGAATYHLKRGELDMSNPVNLTDLDVRYYAYSFSNTAGGRKFCWVSRISGTTNGIQYGHWNLLDFDWLNLPDPKAQYVLMNRQGTYAVYLNTSGSLRLYTVDFTSGAPIVVEPNTNDMVEKDMDFSPDGDYLVFKVNNGPIKELHVADPLAYPATLVNSGTLPRYSRSGLAIYYADNDQIYQVTHPGGEITALTSTTPSGDDITQLCVAPAESALVYIRKFGTTEYHLCRLDLATSTETVLYNSNVEIITLDW